MKTHRARRRFLNRISTLIISAHKDVPSSTTHTHSTKTWQHGVCIFHTASTILICEFLHRSERKISLVEVIWKYHIAFHCWTAWSCVLHTFAAFPPSPSLGPRSFATRFRKGLVLQNLQHLQKCCRIFTKIADFSNRFFSKFLRLQWRKSMQIL